MDKFNGTTVICRFGLPLRDMRIPFTPSAFTYLSTPNSTAAGKKTVSPPAAADGFLSVAAVGAGPEGFTIASFSNVGARLSSPGIGVLSAKRGGGLTAMSGTSMATPHVAGVAALWGEKLRLSGQFSGQSFTDRLVASATTKGFKPGFDPADVGAGMVRAPQD